LEKAQGEIMTETAAVTIRKVLGFQKEDQSSHALIGFEPHAGNEFALAFTPETLSVLFATVVNALGQWPMPRMQNRPICSIAPLWIEVAHEEKDSFSLSFQLDHGGWVHFYQDRQSLERLIDLLTSVVRGESSPPPSERGVH
jgi:hypothetical protein